MAHSISQSSPSATSKHLRLVCGALLALMFLSTLGLYARISRAANTTRQVRDAIKVQSQVQRLTQLAQIQLASANTAQGSDTAVSTAANPQTIRETIQAIDQLLNAPQRRAGSAELQAEWAQMSDTWSQLKAAFESGLSDAEGERTQASDRLAASETLLDSTEQIVDTAEGYAQRYSRRTGQLLWLAFVVYGSAIAYLIHTLQKRQKVLKTTVDKIAAASNVLLSAATQQSQTASAQSTAIERANAIIKQVEASAQQATGQANTAMASTTDALQQGKNMDEPMQATLDSVLALAKKVDEMDETIGELNKQTGEIGALSPLFSDFSYRLGMLSLSSSIEEMKNKTHGPDLVWVSDEVRALAEQFQVISQELERLEADLQATLNDAVTLSSHSVSTAHSGSESARDIVQTFENTEAAEDRMVTATQQFLLLIEQQFDAMGEVANALAAVEQNSREMVLGSTQAQAEVEQLEQASQQLQKMT
ncbi:MAG: methyl-accepting chemotaxis protein [Cyanobacteria bacterium J06632_3]